MVNKAENPKRKWRFLTQEGKKTHLLSFRVPVDFPIESLEMKEIVVELDIIVETGKGKKSQRYLEKVLDYYKLLEAEQESVPQ